MWMIEHSTFAPLLRNKLCSVLRFLVLACTRLNGLSLFLGAEHTIAAKLLTQYMLFWFKICPIPSFSDFSLIECNCIALNATYVFWFYNPSGWFSPWVGNSIQRLEHHFDTKFPYSSCIPLTLFDTWISLKLRSLALTSIFYLSNPVSMSTWPHTICSQNRFIGCSPYYVSKEILKSILTFRALLKHTL